MVLDRDGTIVVDRHYLSDPNDLEFQAGAKLGLRKMSEMGFRLVVITNQSGIARGFFSFSKLEEIHERLRQMMVSNGAPLEGIYFCPHGPSDECECRKPKLGLMRQASEELGFDMSESIVIGDKESDIEFGRRAGAATILIGKPGSRPSSSISPDHIVGNLNEAAEIISGRLA
ncbi:MAG: D-glycero-alpha-D-manno-heptose-1,7-bisphosphate 7-phosphatase [Steroidobacteraceae bacterium]